MVDADGNPVAAMPSGPRRRGPPKRKDGSKGLQGLIEESD